MYFEVNLKVKYFHFTKYRLSGLSKTAKLFRTMKEPKYPSTVSSQLKPGHTEKFVT